MCLVAEAGKLERTAVFQSEIVQETRQSSRGRGVVFLSLEDAVQPDGGRVIREREEPR